MTGAACPKRMDYGPCGGVHADRCEVDRRPCPFLDDSQRVRLTAAAEHTSRQPVGLIAPGPMLVVDVRAPARWAGDEQRLWQAGAGALPGCVALRGEHVDNPRGEDDAGDVDATVAIETLAAAGVTVVATVTGRDRDLVGAQATMSRYAAAGVAAIHCVTGDHPAAVGIARTAAFAAEAVTLVALANDLGLPATVGESPASPGPRVQRMQLKQAAGAGLCILNHSGEVADLTRFVDACRSEGVAIPFVAPVPLAADPAAAAALRQFPGLRLPQEFLDRVTAAADPAEASLGFAAQMASELADSGRFVGINLSGSATGADPYARIELTARFAATVRAAWTASA